MKKVLYLLVVFALLTACRPKEDKSFCYALTVAHQNRQELGNVLLHYKNNSLKLKAAQFLIANMPYYSYFESDRFDELKKIVILPRM